MTTRTVTVEALAAALTKIAGLGTDSPAAMNDPEGFAEGQLRAAIGIAARALPAEPAGAGLLTLEQVSDALNGELDDTEGGNALVAAVLDRLAALTATPVGEEEG